MIFITWLERKFIGGIECEFNIADRPSAERRTYGDDLRASPLFI